MDEKEKSNSIESQDESTQEKFEEKNPPEKSGLGKVWNILKKTTTKIGTEIKKGIQNVGAKIEDAQEEKKLEAEIQKAFYIDSIEYKIVTPGDKPSFKKIKAKTDYSNRLLTLYGEVKGLMGCYLVDSENQKFNIIMIRQNQHVMITVGGTDYERIVTIIQFDVRSDSKTKEEVRQIITSINISNSQISKSDIGGTKE